MVDRVKSTRRRFPSGEVVGRPSSYNPKYAGTAKKLCELGATDADLATALGVTVPTIWAWRSKYRDFFSAIKRGKDSYDELVERALAQRAVGYSFDCEEIKVVDREVRRVRVRKHVPPDVTACIFWLKNRRPEQWRDVNRFEHTGRDGGPMEIDHDARREVERRITGIASRLAAQEVSDKSRLN